MVDDKDIYMINEVCLPTAQYGIQEQTARKICSKCGKEKSQCKCK